MLKQTTILDEPKNTREKPLQTLTHRSCNESPPKRATKLCNKRTCLHTTTCMKRMLDLHDKILHELLNPNLLGCGASSSIDKSKFVNWVPMSVCFPSSNGPPGFTLYPCCDLEQLSIGKGPSSPHKVHVFH
jgi:hypothetical protein